MVDIKGLDPNINNDPLSTDSMDPNDPISIMYDPEIKTAATALVAAQIASAEAEAEKNKHVVEVPERSGLAGRRDLSRVDKKL